VKLQDVFPFELLLSIHLIECVADPCQDDPPSRKNASSPHDGEAATAFWSEFRPPWAALAKAGVATNKDDLLPQKNAAKLSQGFDSLEQKGGGQM
jgi:hypothetical protein